MRLILAGLLAALALPAAALEAPGDYAGPWTISGVSEGDDVCTVILTDEAAIGGWAIEIPRDCFDKFGFSEDIAAWTVRPDGVIGFIDPLRAEKLTFVPTDIGGYVAEPDEGPPLALDRAGKGDIELTEQQRMSGRLTLNGLGGVVLCAWDSTAREDGMAGTLVLSEPCTGAWKAAVRWTRDDLALRLLDAGGRTLVVLKGESLFGFFSPPDGEPPLAFGRSVN